MKVTVNEKALRDLLSITQRTIDGGEAFLFFDDEYTRQQLDAVVALSVSLREQIGRSPSYPSNQSEQDQTLVSDCGSCCPAPRQASDQ